MTENIISLLGRKKNSGTAVILPDDYDNNLILKARIINLIDDLPKIEPIFINRRRTFVAELLKETLSPDDFALCLILNKGGFYSCYINSAMNTDNLNYCQIGESYKVKNIPLKDYIDYMEEPEDVVEAFYNMIHEIISTVPINKIAITGNLFTHLKALKEILSESFSDTDLKFYYFDYSNYAPYLANKLRKSISKDLTETYLNK